MTTKTSTPTTTTAKTWTSKELADIQAARIAGECPGCRNLARAGVPAQCNHCRRVAPDALTEGVAPAMSAALLSYLAAHATTEI